MTIDQKILARLSLLRVQRDRLIAGHGLLEEALSRHHDDIDAWAERRLGDLTSTDPDDEDVIKFLHAEQQEEAATSYPIILRSSLFATAFGILEHFLVSVCKDLEPIVDGLKLVDLTGSGIERAHRYLTKCAKVPLVDSPEWQRIILYGRLRNALVHAQGDLTGNSNLQAIKQLSKMTSTFNLSSDDSTVVLLEGFNPAFVATIETFSEQLDAAFDEHWKMS